MLKVFSFLSKIVIASEDREDECLARRSRARP